MAIITRNLLIKYEIRKDETILKKIINNLSEMNKMESTILKQVLIDLQTIQQKGTTLHEGRPRIFM